MEFLMSQHGIASVIHEDALTFLARDILKQPDLHAWKVMYKTPGGFVIVDCNICGERLEAHQKTYGVETKKLVKAHGETHLTEALAGKFHQENT